MQVELYDKHSKKRLFDIPKGYRIKKEGVLVRGDKFWNNGFESWMTVEDSHTFLGGGAQLMYCAIEKEVE